MADKQATTQRDGFKSKWGFILACIGSAVGMGNIWRFPIMVSLWGGMTFLIPYFICVILIGSTGVIGEFALGRATGAGPIGAFGKCTELRGNRKIGEAIGFIPVLGSMALAIGYTVVMGWIFKYTAIAITGDMHAITAANNLLCAILDNHMQQGNELNIDQRRILFKRCMDMNDRALRFVNVGLGGKANGIPREDGFQITVASEVMAILCLASDMQDLKERLGNILVAYTYDNKPVYAKDLKVNGAMAVLLKDAIKPNLVQTLENTPALMHGGPFANIAHGCNSVRATKLALKLADYTITEAGFGSDLGAEKFLDIKCRYAGLKPSAIVVVATLRALKYNGGVPKAETAQPNVEAVKAGLCNLAAHVENMKKFGVPVVVAINHFLTDSDEEIAVLENYCRENDVEFALSDVFAKGGEGGVALAEKVVKACEKPANFAPLYDVELPIKEKIDIIAKNIYGADSVVYSSEALKSIANIEKLGQDKLPICMAKTQYSLSDDPSKLGRPTGFKLNIRDVKLSAGAGFIVALSGTIMTMPGLGKDPAAYRIDIDEDGHIHGLF